MKSLYLSLICLLLPLYGSAQASQTTDIQAALEEEALPSIGTRYYYYPNLDAYFDTHENLYIFEQQGQWVKAKELRSGYRGYSVMNNVRVAINDYNGDRPYTKLDEHRKQFPKNYSAKRKPPKVVQSDSKIALN